MIEALDIQVKGIVQGVGFRPFVYRLAKRYLIDGWVLNAVDGVFIHAEGEEKLLDEFVMELHMNPPAAAQVSEVDLKEVPLQDCTSFEIRFSDQAQSEETTLVSPDLAICDDCVVELFNPEDRRYRYPFINCTNCGPRFTIIDRLPYDRAKTSMRDFPLCSTCSNEYHDPLNRRFHAQPNACFDCGPMLSYTALPGSEFADGMHVDACEAVKTMQGIESAIAADANQTTEAVGETASALCNGYTNACVGETLWAHNQEESDAIIVAAVQLLMQGGIVAVKGLGGFHLVCDANNAQAMATLRQRKHRQGKAFAVMMHAVSDVEQVCCVSAEEKKVLNSAARPIVLLRARENVHFVPGLNDGLAELGVMLPYTPLQYLLLHDFAQAYRQAYPAQNMPPMLVMTSGNVHNEPIVVDDSEAHKKFVGIADAVIGNNRAIRTRFDDSVVRVVRAGDDTTAIQLIRRARGYCPMPLRVSQTADALSVDDCLFCVGPEQKNTFTLVRASSNNDTSGVEAFVSQHIGDLENKETYDAWLQAKDRFQALFNMKPSCIVSDLHPEYLSTKWAVQQHEEQGAVVIQTQHHHAHIASVLGEHGITDAVCGIAFDGTGYGMDDAIWGGEVLLANTAAFERFANFAYVPMPGGAAAIKHPLRMAYGVLWAYDLLEHEAAEVLLSKLGMQADACDEMIEKGINTPYTSSVGRLFDAASALLGLCDEAHYEGEPAIVLGAMAERSCEGGVDASADASTNADAGAAERYAISFVKNTATENSTAQDTSVLLMDAEPTFCALLDDMRAGVPVPLIARRFHDAFVEAVVMAAELIRSAYGISTVALSGGVFMNRYLIEHCLVRLQNAGFQVAINRDLPPNDGCISFGQAVIALNTEKDS